MSPVLPRLWRMQPRGRKPQSHSPPALSSPRPPGVAQMRTCVSMPCQLFGTFEGKEVRHRNGSAGTGGLRREDTEPADPSVRLPPSSIPARAQRTRSRPPGSLRNPGTLLLTEASGQASRGRPPPPPARALPEVSRPSRCPARLWPRCRRAPGAAVPTASLQTAQV